MRLTPCPSCGAPRRAGCGCAACGYEPKGTRPDLRTAASKRRNADTVAAWVEEHGWICPGWRRPPHRASDLTADHVDQVVDGGSPGGALRVLCRSCNSARGATGR